MPTQSLARTASWVIKRLDGEVMFETYNERLVSALNTEKYTAVPILEYLQLLNRKGA